MASRLVQIRHMASQTRPPRRSYTTHRNQQLGPPGDGGCYHAGAQANDIADNVYGDPVIVGTYALCDTQHFRPSGGFAGFVLSGGGEFEIDQPGSAVTHGILRINAVNGHYIMVGSYGKNPHAFVTKFGGRI